MTGRVRVAGGVLAALVAIVVLSLLQISALHSPLVFDDLFGRDATRVLGHARFVRGDEFVVETPVALGQARSGFPERMTVGEGQDDDVHAYAPGSWASMLYRPVNVWFRVLSPWRAVIARSWTVAAVALAAFYALARTFDGRLRRRVAALLAVAAVLSPPMMWWFTTTHWLAVSFGILGPLAVVAGSRRRGAVVGAAAGGYLLALGAMTTYPAFFLSCALATSLIAAPRWWHGGDRWLRAGVAVLSLAVVAGPYYGANSAWFRAVLDTVYPGGRTSRSGEDSVRRALSGPFARLLQVEPPVLDGNPSENASPIYVLPLAFAALVAARRWRPRAEVRRAALGAVVALALLWGWAFGWLPTPVGRLLGFGGVPGARTVMALVIVATALGAAAVGHSRWGSFAAVPRWSTSLAAAVAVLAVGAAVVMGEGAALRRRVGAHELPWRVVALVTFAVLAAAGAVVAWSRATAAAGAVALLSAALTFGVHPLSIGTGSGDRVAREVRALDRADAAGGRLGRWLADDDVRLNAVVVAAGVSTWSGVHFVPDRAMWRVLDPTDSREHEWNRYAHVVFRLRDGADAQAAPVITAVQADAIVVEVGLCRPELAALKVDRVLSFRPLQGPCVTGGDRPLARGRLHVTSLALAR